MVSYNIDEFKQFVFESTFLQRYNVAEETIKNIKADELALLQFGLQWLRSVLFKNVPLKH